MREFNRKTAKMMFMSENELCHIYVSEPILIDIHDNHRISEIANTRL